MWKDFVKDLPGIFLSVWLEDRISARKRESLNRRLAPTIMEMMERFADSSLDCDAFYRMVKSEPFVEMVRLYYFSLSDRKGSREYTACMEAYILRECPAAQSVEVREFLAELENFYERHLLRVLEGDPGNYALYQTLIRANREVLGKISESEESLRKYINARLDSGTQITDADIADYHRVSEKQYARVRFTGISGAENKREQNINEFYVENPFSYYSPEFRLLEERDREEAQSVCLGDFFKNGNKIILIGGAGLGKTTTLHYLYCNYERIYDAYAVKIKINLKECAEDIEHQRKDILDCITTEFYKKIKRTKLTLEAAGGLLAGFLEKGKCLLIFDALDEIPAQATRNKVRDEIASFCDLYYLNRFIISTREVGYLRNRFDDSFLHIRINEFHEEQVKQYSRNWYAANYGETPVQSEGEDAEQRDEDGAFRDFWEKFQIEAGRARCQNMIRNPIILILALVIFDIEKSLPNRRVKFYEKCIDTFLTVREDRKGAVKLSEKVKDILAMERVVPQIAYYQFERVSKNAGYKFTYEELREAVFLAIRVEDRLNWSAAVDEYDNYLVERTELIREVDENVLDFAHKTFYEYFLAVYFTKQTGPDALCELLQEWIGDANYDEMARLIIEVVIQNDDPIRHDTVIRFLFSQIERERHAEAILSILADLYAHNLLQPQYHGEYHRCILYYAWLVDRVQRRFVRQYRERIRYDEKLLSGLYRQALSEPDGFAKTLDALYFLNQTFRDRVCRECKYEEPIVRVASLISRVRKLRGNTIFTGSPRKLQELLDLLRYFCGEGLPYTLEHPQIYLSVVTLMARTENFGEAEKLLAPHFAPGAYLFSYTDPVSVFPLFERATDTPEQLLLALLCVIYYAKDATNLCFNQLLEMLGYKNDKKRDREARTYKNLILLWCVLYQTESCEEFQTALMDQGLYAKEYAELYRKLYTQYAANEKEIDSDMVKKHLRNVDLSEWKQLRLTGFS